MPVSPPPRSEAHEAILRGAPALHARLNRELRKRIVGQETVLRDLFVCLLAQGHALMVGVPGLAKTLIVKTLAEAVDLDFRRIQFTPDLMPSDVTGSEIVEETGGGQRAFRFVRGPVFTQLLLADEINRAPAKTQAALLEAMQERRVTIGGQTRDLPAPFFVLATQNPIEQEGTYPLPEAQLDRFLCCLRVSYPNAAEEAQILHATTGTVDETVAKICTAEELLVLQNAVRQIHLPASVADFAVHVTRSTRPGGEESTALVRRCVQWGAGPRASQALVLVGKALAALDGRLNCAVEDITAAAHVALRHRLILNYRAEAENLTTDQVIEDVLARARH